MAFLKTSMESLLDWRLRVDTELATKKLQMSSMERKMDELIAMIREEKWKLNFRDNYGGQTSTIARAEDIILIEACVERPPKEKGGHFQRGDITTVVSQLPSYETEPQNPSHTSTVTYSHATI